MYLTRSEKEKIAHKISQNIAMVSILDEIRNSVHDNFERMYLLTFQDIKNIKKEFNINQNGILHVNDKVSINIWIAKCRNDEDSPILLYKDQNNINDALYPGLKTEDFLLVIMNSSQKEMLKSYGDNINCPDFTHGMNSFGFDLATVLVLGDKREGFPAAFIISNRQDRVALEVAFKAIKKEVTVNSNIIMTDDTESFCNAWENIFGEPKKKIIVHLARGSKLEKKHRLMQIEKGKISNKMRVLRNRHVSGHEINTPYEDMKNFKILVLVRRNY
ncbi:MULE domain-containing protein [Caerostris darwini]|uniref:MULE domain-containing protein n=1 Tax=Caerostris darwini TaxID=1538125 RepID=A0AAV4RGI7_9ARAC|nr:MULE domain-containing protein [Caerostris darwini]